MLRELGGMNRLVDEMLTLAASESTDLVRKQRIELDDFVEDLRRDLPLLGERSYSVSGTSGGTLTADPAAAASGDAPNLLRNFPHWWSWCAPMPRRPDARTLPAWLISA